jgi:hypothetical protein
MPKRKCGQLDQSAAKPTLLFLDQLDQELQRPLINKATGHLECALGNRNQNRVAVLLPQACEAEEKAERIVRAARQIPTFVLTTQIEIDHKTQHPRSSCCVSLTNRETKLVYPFTYHVHIEDTPNFRHLARNFSLTWLPHDVNCFGVALDCGPSEILLQANNQVLTHEFGQDGLIEKVKFDSVAEPLRAACLGTTSIWILTQNNVLRHRVDYDHVYDAEVTISLQVKSIKMFEVSPHQVIFVYHQTATCPYAVLIATDQGKMEDITLDVYHSIVEGIAFGSPALVHALSNPEVCGDNSNHLSLVATQLVTLNGVKTQAVVRVPIKDLAKSGKGKNGNKRKNEVLTLKQKQRQIKGWFRRVFGNQNAVHGVEINWNRLRELQAQPRAVWSPEDFCMVEILQQQYASFLDGPAFTRQ